MKNLLKLFTIFILVANLNLVGQNLTASTDLIDNSKNSFHPSTNSYIISNKMFSLYPYREITNIIALTPGVNLYNNKIYFRGSDYYETGFYIDNTTVRDPLTGLPFINLPLEAIEETEIITGNYEAIHGKSGPGIIINKIKTGGKNLEINSLFLSDNLGFKSGDNFFNGGKFIGAHTYGHNEVNINIGGPLISEYIRFFVNFNNKFKRDRTPQDFPGIDLGYIKDLSRETSLENFFYPAGPILQNKSNEYNITGSLLFNYERMKIKLSGNYNSVDLDAGSKGVLSYLNSRTGEELIRNGFINIEFDHKVSSTISYNIYVGYSYLNRTTQDPYLKGNYQAYGDSIANNKVGWTWDYPYYGFYLGRFAYPTPLYVMGFPFYRDGTPVIGYSKSEWNNFTFEANSTIYFNENNKLNFGLHYSKYKIRSWSLGDINNQLKLARLLHYNTNYEEETLLLSGVNNYGYDVVGNKIEDDFFHGPREPYFGRIFGQYTGSFGGFHISASLKYNLINYDYIHFTDFQNPQNSLNSRYLSGVNDYNREGWQEQKSYNYFETGISATYQFNQLTFANISYGSYLSAHKFEDIYLGTNYIFYSLYGGFPNRDDIPHKDIKPIITRIFEIAFTHSFKNNINISITGFIKDIENQLNSKFENTAGSSPFANYTSAISDRASQIKGIESLIEIKDFKDFHLLSSLSYQNGVDNSSRLKLQHNYDLTTNHILSYSFKNQKYFNFLNDLSFSIIYHYSNGHPNNLQFGSPLDDNSFIVQENTPSIQQFDLRINKTFQIIKNIKLDIYLLAINLFDYKNIINVFPKTGSATDDGYISNVRIAESLVETYGEKFLDIYKAINLDYYSAYKEATNGNLMFGPPRQLIFGIKLSY